MLHFVPRSGGTKACCYGGVIERLLKPGKDDAILFSPAACRATWMREQADSLLVPLDVSCVAFYDELSSVKR
jgi:hypothetical protein